jgi:hypothetical protein
MRATKEVNTTKYTELYYTPNLAMERANFVFSLNVATEDGVTRTIIMGARDVAGTCEQHSGN